MGSQTPPTSATSMSSDRRSPPRVVIAGAGFAGLWAARVLAGSGCEVTLVDRHNYHTFPALLYQVAAAILQAEDIAYPFRSILWSLPRVHFVLGTALRADPGRRILETDVGPTPFDYLVLATGSVPQSFGVPGVEEHAFYLKDLDQAICLRNHIVCCFEAATRTDDPELRRQLLTFTVVGGGATGVEYAGALAELLHGPMPRDYPTLDFAQVHIVLVEAAPELLTGLPERIRSYAARRLRQRGVEVRLGTTVDRVDEDDVHLTGEAIIPTRTVVWTAGVKGEPIAAASGLSGRDGRVPVLPTLQVSGHPRLYAVGDLARIEGPESHLPMVAQVAIQSGSAAARNIRRDLSGAPPLPFRYDDKGLMVAIGRNAAGAVLGGRPYVGFPAWILWLVVHLYKLIGFRNRLLVLINWAWDYSIYKRAARLVFPSTRDPRQRPTPPTPEK